MFRFLCEAKVHNSICIRIAFNPINKKTPATFCLCGSLFIYLSAVCYFSEAFTELMIFFELASLGFRANACSR